MNDKTLLPCPFCGSDFKVSQEPHDNHPVNGLWYLFHAYGELGSSARRCLIDVPKYFDTKEEAMAAWNTRAPTALQARVDVLEADNAWMKREYDELSKSAGNKVAAQQSRIEALEAALRKIAGGAKTGEEMFKERLGYRKSPTWFAVNVLQDSLDACRGTAERALESKP